MIVDLVLHNMKVYVNGELLDAGIAINDGKIFKIAKETNLLSADRKLDLKGCLALPGLIDAHVHLRDQQQAYEEDFFSGTCAAAAGGITCVIDMPNNKPVTMNAASLRERMRIAESKIVVNVAFYSEFPQKLEEVSQTVKEGAVAFKLFLSQKVGGLDIDDDKAIIQAFNVLKSTNVPVAVHAEDRTLIEKTMAHLQQNGREDINAYLKTHSPLVEAKAIKRMVRLIRKCGIRIHFCHISSGVGLNAVSAAKSLGLPVSCEVTPHHLLLSSKNMKSLGTISLTIPPLRSRQTVNALWNGVKRGLIDTIASDHAPHAIEEKRGTSVWHVKTGVPGLETTLPLFLTQVNTGRLTLAELVRLTSEKPAEIFGLNRKGFLKEGCEADIVVVDMNREGRIVASKFYSKAKYSPFNNWRVRGKPVKTFVGGHLVMDEGEIVAKPGAGKIVRRGA